jgi:hypothetical protein
MAVDPTTPRTRRAFLAGGLVAAAASLGRAQPVSGHDADDVRLGGSNSAITVTTITNTVANGDALVADASGYGNGVAGSSPTGIGVYGNSPSGRGVQGDSGTIEGVYGFSHSGTGVYGFSQEGDGMQAVSATSGKSGLNAQQSDAGGWAVNGGNEGAETNGYMGGANGLLGQARGSTGSGVVGYAGSGSPPVGPAHAGVYGVSGSGRGGVFKGNLAQLKLLPSSHVTHPASGQRGDFFVDKSGRLWFCKGGTTWVKVA